MSAHAAVEHGTFQYHGRTLAYTLLGDADGRPCVLVHGILLDSLLNLGLAKRFAALGYRVALLDLLGHGRSERSADPKDHRVDFYADQVLALLDHLGWRSALVGGVSLGCITALTVAVKAPQRVEALFLEMPVMEWSAPWAALLLSPILVSARYGALLHRRVARFVGRLPRPPVDWLASVMNMASNDPRTVAAILHGVLVGPLVPPVAQRRTLTMPTLIIGHRNDKLHEHRDARSLAAQLPNATLLMARSIVELRIRPQRLWPQIESFLKSLPVVPAPAPAALAAPSPRAAAKRAAKQGKAGRKRAVPAPPAAPRAPGKAATKTTAAKKATAKKAAAKKAAKKVAGKTAPRTRR